VDVPKFQTLDEEGRQDKEAKRDKQNKPIKNGDGARFSYTFRLLLKPWAGLHPEAPAGR
jgi:hypothetical protein